MADDLTYFKGFYERLQPGLRAYAFYILKNEEEAMEVVNDVFVNIWERRAKLGPFDAQSPARLRAYAFQAVKNTCLNRLRQQRKSWMQLDEEVPDPVGASRPLEQKEIDAQLNRWIQELPPRCRQVFLMSRVDGLSNKDIADLMEISVKTVENQMTKALDFFRKKMGMG